MESVMTISLSKKLGEMHKPRGVRHAASRIRFLVARSAKVDMSFVSIDPAVNNYILSTAIKNRSKVKLNISRSGNEVKVALYGAKPVAKQEQQPAKQKPAAKTSEAASKDNSKQAKAPTEGTAKPNPSEKKLSEAKPKPAAEKKPEKKDAQDSKEGKM